MRRIIAEICSSLNIDVQVIEDHNASVPSQVGIAVCPVEALHHDMFCQHHTNKVRYLNYVGETNSAWNGTACVLAPWQGKPSLLRITIGFSQFLVSIIF